MIYRTSIIGADVAVNIHERIKHTNNVESKILDLGFGNGEIVAQFLQFQYNVVAVDINQDNCTALLRSLIENQISPSNLTIHHQNVIEYAFDEGPYSAIICQNLLHFLSKQDALILLRKMIHHLEIGGFLWLVVHYKEQPYVKKLKKEILSLFDETDIDTFLDGTLELYYYEKAWKPKTDQSVGLSYLVRKIRKW